MIGEASMEMTEFAVGKKSQADAALFVVFDEQPWLNQAKTAEMGRPIYEPRDFIMIMIPGDKDTVIHRKANEMDRARFPQQYALYKNKANQGVVGTPLAAVTFLTASQVKELEFFNCHTVEQLSQIPDSQARNFLELQKFKTLAKDYLEQAAGMAPLTKVREELALRDQQLASANEALQELGARLKALEAKVVQSALDE